ncbi:S-adenosyl methyltransferase [Kribbella sp. VKM Ac-2569]|uniref:SAM-dependent methyltransferase n=1 Tax=Kribbella sp. VKM Ac-2569 TaxID=2512220 RepID=UPI00102C82AE|nr:SAM-dependent methyltransferase [Kribbella sp. VKM Ac-2569]RZT20224.1 S-adenosyl methyltransferase [Kribbella sp. VKM Ac-2569]
MPEYDDTHRSLRADEPATIDLERASQARVYDLLLGGKNNFEVDRQFVQELLKIAPEISELTRQNRRWMADAIGRMTTEGRIDQFLDLGAGLPTAQNTHDVALRANPAATVVYVDNDLTAISHGQALLADEQRSFFADADLNDPAAVLAHPSVTGALDLSRPVGILLGLVLHSTPDPVPVVADYLAAVPSGSYLALTHPLNPRDGGRLAGFATAIEEKLQDAFPHMRFRTRDEIAELVAGLELVAPELVDLTSWWPEDEQKLNLTGAGQLLLVALARKP